MPQTATIRTDNESDLSIADSLYRLCKTMTFPLLMSFDALISLPMDELIDIIEVFNFENKNEQGESIVYENGEKIIERVGMRR